MNRRQFIKLAGYTTMAGAMWQKGHAASGTVNNESQLTASSARVTFFSDQASPTEMMSYNQSVPGPVLRFTQGQEAVVQFKNALDQATSVHWHGLRIANAMDGVPGMTQSLVQPGEQFEYRFTPPDAGTYWYHSHQRSWEQMALGLAGVLIVEEKNPPLVDQDIVMALNDWRLNQDMQIDRDSLGAMHDWAHGGRLGNVVTVNGEVASTFPVSHGERVRVRLLNMANSRTMTLLFNQPELSVIAIDGQPVTPFKPESGVITLAPGQRTDLIIDMTSQPNELSHLELLIEDSAYQIASFKFDDRIKREQLLHTPIALAQNPQNRVQLPGESVAIPLRLEGGAMGGMGSATYQGKEMGIRELIQHKQIWAVNGIAGLPETPLFRVKRGTGVRLEVDNANAWPHAMHVHGHHFQTDHLPGIWRDVALFERQQKGSITLLADNPGKWLIHCHMIEHQAGGMVTWFEVT